MARGALTREPRPTTGPRRAPVCVLLEDGDPQLCQRARALAERLALPLREAEEIDANALALVLTGGGLELRDGEAPRTRGVRVDFQPRSITARTRGRPGHAAARQPLLRAIGRRSLRVFDATAGFGDDAIALASVGRRVLAVERSPVVAALLEDGRERALADAALSLCAQRLELRCADSRELLAALSEPPDAVYIDPMYPPKRSRSALPRRQIQLLRRLVGDDRDAGDLLAIALACGAGRVVVKRSPRSPPLGGEPTTSYTGKLVRYDVYHRGRAAAHR